jgi:hypothetical protein
VFERSEAYILGEKFENCFFSNARKIAMIPLPVPKSRRYLISLMGRISNQVSSTWSFR